MKYQCSDCNKKMNFEEIYECKVCGSELCNKCHKTQGRLCENCFGDKADGISSEEVNVLIKDLIIQRKLDEGDKQNGEI